MPSASAIAASVSRTTASYRPACSGVRETVRSVSVFGGSSGAMPGSDLRLRSRKGRTSAASRSAAPGSRPPSTAAANRVRNAPRPPSSPGVVQSRIAHSSERLFSTGVPDSATRARAPMVRSCRAVAEYGFLTCCASSATTSPSSGRRAARRPAAWCRTW
ncbi:hypothetical protein STANM309S_02910 [Streptomyces tanashiensis]